MGAPGLDIGAQPHGRQALLDRPLGGGRSDGIDLLRFVLAFYVILTHLAEWGPRSATGMAWPFRFADTYSETLFQGHSETHPAVVAFIVLSGYCIHRNGARRSTWCPRAYAIKRAFRIIPVYVAASVFGAALFVLALHTNAAVTHFDSATSQITVGRLVAKLSTISALVPIAHMRTNIHNMYEGNGPLYTVAAEIWLYAFYASAMTLLVRRRISERGLWMAIAALVGVGFLLTGTQPTYRIWWFNASVISFLPLWWIGAAAVGDHDPQRVKLTIAGAGLFWALCSLYLSHDASFAVEEARMLAFGVLVAIGVRHVDTRLTELPRFASRLGRSGYSLYAFHAPMLILLVALGILWPAVAIAAVAVGLVAFTVLERPTTQLGRRLARRTPARAIPVPQDGAGQMLTTM